ncbi:hypothetical protein AB0G42_29240 [Streptomyces yangpuensis]|uniref:hypothetical protein n=1 Tax=Streptomyces yangpuensis TaxID=1648182 RepID=UPI0034450AA2
MTEQQPQPQPQEGGLTTRPPHSPHPSHRHADWMFGGVYGTVLASALIAALHQDGEDFTPFYDASWVLVTAATAGLAHGYAHHMASHREGSGRRRWRLLARALWDEWPLVVATLPTVLLLAAAGLGDWDAYDVTAGGLGLNTALLFGWGALVALRVGHRLGRALMFGLADAAIGLAIIAANALIK